MDTSMAVDHRLAGVKAMKASASQPSPSNSAFGTKIEQQRTFDARDFLGTAPVARRVVEYGCNAVIFTQGDPATSVLYIQKGCVKLTVVNEAGREAVVAILGPGDFLGEGCLAGQLQRVNTAEPIAPSTILVIEKQEMIRRLHADPALSERFIKHMLSRNTRIEEDLIDQLFNSSEKRLARTLLLLAHYGKQDKPAQMVSDISQEMLAEMIGTTRPRVNLFMNKFRELGFIEYGAKLHGLKINRSLQSVVLQG
jgi:CRP-like cAMP-binding protein